MDNSIIQRGLREGSFTLLMQLTQRLMFSFGAINNFFILTASESSPAQMIPVSAPIFVTAAF